MPRTMDCLGLAAAATATMAWPMVIWCATATAEPSPGVPCLDLVQQLAAGPPSAPSVPEAIQTAANALNGVVPEEAPVIPPVPVAVVVHGVTALAAPGPVPAPFEADPAAAPLAQSAARVPPAASPIPAVVPPIPPVPVVAAPPVAAPPPTPVLPPVAEPVAAKAIEVSATTPIDATAPAAEAAPLVHAAAVPAAAPGPVVPVVPVVPLGAPVPFVPVVPAATSLPAAAPALPIPAVPLGDAAPGLPLLPATLPVRQDLVCEGTAWSAQLDSADGATPVPASAERRDQW